MRKLKLSVDELDVASYATVVDLRWYESTVGGFSTPGEEAFEALANLFREGEEDGVGRIPEAPEGVGEAPNPVAQDIQMVANLPDQNPIPEVPGVEGGGGVLPQQLPAPVARSPILTSAWNLAKKLATEAAKQVATFGVIYGATVLAAKHVESQHGPECLSVHLQRVQANWEKEFPGVPFTQEMKETVARACLELPSLFDAAC